MTCVQFADAEAVVGTINGDIYRFKLDEQTGSFDLIGQIPGENCHSGPINSMHAGAGVLVTAGDDGKVKRFAVDEGRLQDDVIAELDLKDAERYNCLNPRLRSVCLKSDLKTMLVAARSGDVYEIAEGGDMTSDDPLVQGHFDREVWALAVHPKEREFCTGGEDKTLRVWSYDQHRQLCMVKVDCMIRSACYSPDLNHIAIGLGGEPDERRGEKTVDGSIGQFKVFERKVAEDGTMSLEVVFEERHSKQTIYDIKYSPDGESLAVAAGDNIYFYDVEQQYKHTKTFKKHKMPITHFDFSSESDFIISNCQGGDVFFADAHTGGHIPSPAELKDVDWSTWTVCNGWASMGVHTPYKDGSVVNAVARSESRKL